MNSRKIEADPRVDAALRALDAVARHHMSWICESFVHVLTLREWGERKFSARIDDEYLREVPRVFRAIELILELGGCVDLEKGRRAYVHYLPSAGRTVAEMRDRERASMEGFDARLRKVGEVLASSGQPAAAALVEEARSSRAKYIAWLSENQDTAAGESCARSLAFVTGSAAPVWRALNRLYAHLNPAIEETCVQMLVLRHANRPSDAELVWRDSYAYMLFAADLMRLFARRGWALELTSADVSADVEAPIGGAPDDVFDNRRKRQTSLQKFAKSIAAIAADTDDPEAETIPRGLGDYVAALLEGRMAQPPAPGPRFEAMLADHSYASR
jgi:bacterioferritin (cytochrome b1)